MKKWIVFLIVLLVPVALFAQGNNGDGSGLLTTILIIISTVMTILAGLFGAKWAKISGKIKKGLVVVIEASDVVAIIRNISNLGKKGLENDGKLDVVEMQEIVDEAMKIDKEWLELKAAWKDLVTKQPA